MSVSDRLAAPNRPGRDAATAVWRHRHAIPLALTLLAASALAALIVGELTGSPTIAPLAPLTANAVQPQPGNPEPGNPEPGNPEPARAQPDDLLARPLFAASRHPALVDPAAPTAIAVDDPPYLVGTFMTGRHDRTALLAVANLPKLQAVHEGDTLGHYRILAIDPGEVLADGPSGQLTLHMGPQRHAAAPLQPSPIEAARHAIGAPDQDE